MPNLLLPPDLLARLANLRDVGDLIAFLEDVPQAAPYVRQILIEMLNENRTETDEGEQPVRLPGEGGTFMTVPGDI